jgi:hypothetical protein
MGPKKGCLCFVEVVVHKDDTAARVGISSFCGEQPPTESPVSVWVLFSCIGKSILGQFGINRDVLIGL